MRSKISRRTPLSPEEETGVSLSDRALCIYTSGTTGLPKAANVSHRRIMTWSYWFAGILNTGPADRTMNCLPMYHSVGGIVAIGSVLVSGGSVVLQEKFSARRFWDDVVRWDCTLFQYIGELCRYLLKAPENANERAHHLRLAFGNGLRADVWNAFQERFNIPHIVEFYAATEGTFSLINVEGEPGAIGRVPPFLKHRFPSALVKFDVARGEPMRDSDGFCVPCAPDEIGEAIGKIASGAGAGARFEGYTSAEDSDAKILRNVFAAGDAWFRTGDLMRQDAKGFFYFVDRIGDTFRWKGENVSTFEVAEALNAVPGVIDATAYGVTIPGADGRAGMATLVIEAGLRFEALARAAHRAVAFLCAAALSADQRRDRGDGDVQTEEGPSSRARASTPARSRISSISMMGPAMCRSTPASSRRSARAKFACSKPGRQAGANGRDRRSSPRE